MAKKKREITSENIDVSRKQYIVASLRMASLRWPPRNEALKRARVDRGFYECAACKKSWHRFGVQVDHIKPAVKLSGFTTWDDYVERMLPLPEGYQVLCKPCHEEKTKSEKIIRQVKKKVDKKTKIG